jgi:hypothetical protein
VPALPSLPLVGSKPLALDIASEQQLLRVRMTPSSIESSRWQPSDFACAVAALTALDDTRDEVIAGNAFLSAAAAPGWRAWARVTDWRVDQGDTLFGNLEVRDSLPEPSRGRSLIPREAGAERHVWAQVKIQQLDGLMAQLRLGELPLLRWVAAMVDVMPLEDMGTCVNFRRSAVREECELSAGNVLMSVRRTDERWELKAAKRMGVAEPVSIQVAPGCDEDESLYDLLFKAWVVTLAALILPTSVDWQAYHSRSRRTVHLLRCLFQRTTRIRDCRWSRNTDLQ